MHPHFKPLSKEKLEEMTDRKKTHQDTLVDLRTSYELQNRDLEAIDSELDSLSSAITRLAAEDRFDSIEDFQDSLEDSDAG